MPKIDVALRIGTAEGSEIKVNLPSQEVEALGEIVFELPSGGEKCIAVQPSTKEKLLFLLIRSDRYTEIKDGQEKKIFYCVNLQNDPAAPNQGIELDKDHFYQEAKEITILGEEPQTLKFKSTYDQPNVGEEDKTKAKIQILVGRKAVIDCPQVVPPAPPNP